jgi:Tfp pilus assembly protein PilN
MMRRIELLPQAHLEQRRQRRVTAGVVIAGLVALTMLIGYWLVLGMQVADERNELAQVTARNQQLQAEIDELQRFADMEAELKAKEASLATVAKGDVDWPGLLTEIAMVLPGEVWLTNLTASAGQTEGATQVGTETAPVRVSEEEPFGRIQFQGNSLEMTGVPKWLIRLGTVKEFNALWLNSADKGESTTEGTPEIVTFDSTLELGDEAASDRFQEETP